MKKGHWAIKRGYAIRDKLTKAIMEGILGHPKFEEAFRNKLTQPRVLKK